MCTAAPAWLSHMEGTAQGMLSHVRSHPGGTEVLCNVAGMDGPFTTKLKIPLTCSYSPYPYVCLYLLVFIYRKLFTLCLVPFQMPCDQIHPQVI